VGAPLEPPATCCSSPLAAAVLVEGAPVLTGVAGRGVQ
jgi:hypothetical protein